MSDKVDITWFDYADLGEEVSNGLTVYTGPLPSDGTPTPTDGNDGSDDSTVFPPITVFEDIYLRDEVGEIITDVNGEAITVEGLDA